MENIFAVGQQVMRRAGLALAVRHQGLDHLAGLVLLSLHHDSVAAVVDDLESDPLKVGVALGSGTGDGVLLLYAETATLHVIHSGDCNRVAVLPHLDSLALPGQQHGLVGGGFTDFVGAVGKGIIARAGVAIFVRGDGHNNVAHGVSLAAHHHGVGGTVDNLELNASEGRISLGRCPHLAVLLLQVNAAPNNFIFCLVL